MQSYILDHLWFTAEQPSIEDHHFTLNFALGFEKMRAAAKHIAVHKNILLSTFCHALDFPTKAGSSFQSNFHLK